MKILVLYIFISEQSRSVLVRMKANHVNFTVTGQEGCFMPQLALSGGFVEIVIFCNTKEGIDVGRQGCRSPNFYQNLSVKACFQNFRQFVRQPQLSLIWIRSQSSPSKTQDYHSNACNFYLQTLPALQAFIQMSNIPKTHHVILNYVNILMDARLVVIMTNIVA